MGNILHISALSGEYVKQELLGSGSYGTVWRITHKRSKKEYACKIVKLGSKVNEQHLRNETAIMAQLDHPNICKIYKSFTKKGKMYIIMEYIQGQDLYQRLKGGHESEMTEWHIAMIIKQMASACAYIHERGIVHRDLKPGNVMFAKKHNPKMDDLKVIDFGFAKNIRDTQSSDSSDSYIQEHDDEGKCDVVDKVPRTHTQLGSPAYCAPEILKAPKNKKQVTYGFDCDMWSLGIILYELLAGHSPIGKEKVKKRSHLKKLYRRTLSLDIKANMEKCKEFQGCSESAKDLLSKLLIPTKSGRFTAKQVLKHSWLLQCDVDLKTMISRSSKSIVNASSARFKRTKRMLGRRRMQKVVKRLVTAARIRSVLNVLLGLAGEKVTSIELMDFIKECPFLVNASEILDPDINRCSRSMYIAPSSSTSKGVDTSANPSNAKAPSPSFGHESKCDTYSVSTNNEDKPDLNSTSTRRAR